MESIVFIILNYNGAKETQELADSLCLWKQEQIKLQVVVVDNCSTDNSFDELSVKYADNATVDVIQSGKNGGYSFGNNVGVRFAIEKYDPEYIAIANPDIVIDENTCVQLLKTFEVDTRIAMCAPVMKGLNGSFRVASLRVPDYRDDIAACWALGKQEEEIVTLAQDPRMVLTEVLPGSFFVIKADVFVGVGLFDENVFLYCEERILGRKIKEAGYLAVIRSDLFFVHAHSVTINKAMSVKRQWRQILASRLYYEKEYGKCGVIKMAVLRVAMWSYMCQLSLLQFLHRVLPGKSK